MALRSLGSVASVPPHRSFFLDRLIALAGDSPIDEWLVEQANARGFHGAVGLSRGAGFDASVSPEEILVALLMPQSVLDVRLFRLVVRMVQSGRLAPGVVSRLARRERADSALWWLLERVPDSEQNEHVRALVATLAGPPRGYRPPVIDYDSSRLVHRPFAGFSR